MDKKEVAKIFEQLDKAVEVLKAHKIFEALEYIHWEGLESGYGIEKVELPRGSGVVPDSNTRKIKYVFHGVTYEFCIVDEETWMRGEFALRGRSWRMGTYNLLVDGAPWAHGLVLQIKCIVDYAGEDLLKLSKEPVFDKKNAKLHFRFSDNTYSSRWAAKNVKVLKLGEWVKELPVMVDLAKAGSQKIWNENEAEAKELEGNIDLGDFE